MKDGFIKVAAVSPDLKVADCRYNAAEIIKKINIFGAQKTALLVFPELSLTAYTCADLFSQRALLDCAEKALAMLLEASANYETLCAVGMPAVVCGKTYNCAVIFQRGKILGVVPKSFATDCGGFYESRNFACAPEKNITIELCGQTVPFGTKLLFCCRELPEFIVAAEICEDLWAPAAPSAEHALAGATVIINLSASNEHIGKAQYRRMTVSAQSSKLVCGYVFADAGRGESTTDMVFSGHDLIAENGRILAESKPFADGEAVTEIDVQRISQQRRITAYPAINDIEYVKIPFSVGAAKTTLTRRFDPHPFIPSDEKKRADRCEEILAIQARALQKRMEHTKAAAAVLGVSGGLDSTLALIVVARTFELMGKSPKDIIAVTMPCFGTTSRTKGNAELLSEKIGATLRCIDIKAAVDRHFADIGHDPKKIDVTFENSQARERTQVLMDIANQTGGLVIGTGDLSELALGWATYNGDHMSMYGVNASVPKTLMRYLVAYVADTTADMALGNILRDILDTPVSPELIPPAEGEISQQTEKIVGPYELHDFFLYYFLRWGFSPSKILRLAMQAFDGKYDEETIRGWLKVFYRRFFSQQYKRSCSPDAPKVGSVSLSPRGDWRMPSDAVGAVWLDEIG